MSDFKLRILSYVLPLLSLIVFTNNILIIIYASLAVYWLFCIELPLIFWRTFEIIDLSTLLLISFCVVVIFASGASTCPNKLNNLRITVFMLVLVIYD
ncbi:hypothetical protein [Mycoplasmopsis cynos]|uniref:hypothetical protein n=1 Tax=Mycoplasmopsis cynos TaxID=171284 RepID=UPI0024C5A54F|nr:hypothetical protein [Mycoplasmopsis cynos]WAM05170.1 hypothetical protein ONA01_03505 [Mycoplasmopsis cynos]